MRGKNWILPAIGILLLGIFMVLPAQAPLTTAGMRAIGIFLFTIIWWASVGVGYPSLITLVLLAAAGVMSPKDVFATSWGNWIVLFVLGSFGMTETLRSTGFSRRFALWFISRPFVAGHPWRLVAMFLLACTTLGGVMSGTATTIVFLAIAEPMLEAMGYKKGDDFSAMFMMGVAWAATVSLAMTPIGHAGNILAMEWIKRDFAYNITFLQWMAYGVPMGLLTLGLLLLMFRFVVKPDVGKISAMATNFVKTEAKKMGPMKLEEKVALGLFMVVVAVWMLPSFASGAFPALSSYLEKQGFAIPVLAGACALCVIKVHDKPLLTFHDWVTTGVEWDTLSLIATIGTLGAVIESPATGISAYLSQVLEPVGMALPFWAFLVFILSWVTIQTNLMSNLVSFTLVYSIMIPVASKLNLGFGPALGVTIAFASNYAFSLPSATTSTAIVTGTRWVPVPFMAKYGLPIVIPVIIFFAVIGYPYALLIFR